MKIEICTADIESVEAAIEGGASRIELCTALEAGGLTPSDGLLRQAIRKCRESKNPVKVHVLIRSRSGDFLYTEEDITVMEADVAHAIEAGADGIVFGALTADGEIDTDACRRILKTVEKYQNDGKEISTTFHRAFDFCNNPVEAMRIIAGMGFDRILTSGQAPSAIQGKALIRELMEKSPEGFSIMAGAGVDASNLKELADSTNIREAHASAKKLTESRMNFHRESVNTGGAGNSDYARYLTDASLVAELIAIANQL